MRAVEELDAGQHGMDAITDVSEATWIHQPQSRDGILDVLPLVSRRLIASKPPKRIFCCWFREIIL